MQHLAAYLFLMVPIYGTLETITALMLAFDKYVLPVAAIRILLAPFVAGDSLYLFRLPPAYRRALMAQDEQVRVRRFLSFRVFWKLVRMLPSLVVTQTQALLFFGPGWITGDCLWPVVQVVEKLSGRAAIQRFAQSDDRLTLRRTRAGDPASRTGGVRGRNGHHVAGCSFAKPDTANRRMSYSPGTWFPIFALYAAAPLFLYDRTAASESGPLLQLDRTPEVRVTARTFSVSSMIWLAAGVVYLLFVAVKVCGRQGLAVRLRTDVAFRAATARERVSQSATTNSRLLRSMLCSLGARHAP